MSDKKHEGVEMCDGIQVNRNEKKYGPPHITKLQSFNHI